MTRLTEFLLSKRPLRKFANYRHIPVYRELLPAKLRDTVSSKGERGKIAPCLQEISLMLTCLKEHEFSEMLCSKEVQAFNKCNEEFKAAKTKQKERDDLGVMSTGKGGRMNSKQLNNLLKQYPQPK